MVSICKLVVLYLCIRRNNQTNLCLRVGNIFVRYKVLVAFENISRVCILAVGGRGRGRGGEDGTSVRDSVLIPVGFDECEISSQ